MDIKISTTKYELRFIKTYHHFQLENPSKRKRESIFTGYFHEINFFLDKKIINLFNIVEISPFEIKEYSLNSILNPLKDDELHWQLKDSEYGIKKYFPVIRNINEMDNKSPFVQLIKNFKLEEKDIFHYIEDYFPLGFIFDRCLDLLINQCVFKAMYIYTDQTWKKINYYIRFSPNGTTQPFTDNFEKYSKRIGIENFLLIKKEEDFVKNFKEIVRENLDVIDMQIDFNNC